MAINFTCAGFLVHSQRFAIVILDEVKCVNPKNIL